MKNIHLTKTTTTHLPIFFQNQTDPEANQMAGFTAKDPNDKEAYIKKWTTHLKDEKITMRTILLDNEIAGTICTYPMNNELHIPYWINKSHWGKGVATKALHLFLQEFSHRPIHGSTAFDNHGSMKVLQNNGFQKNGSGHYHANARGKEIEEIFWMLKS